MNNNPIRQRRRSATEIQELLQRYHQSQLTQAEFVKAEGICLGTLSRHLRREKLKSIGGEPHGFVEIDPVNAIQSIAHRDPFRVCLSEGVSVEIYPGFCAVEVTRLFSVLNAMGTR